MFINELAAIFEPIACGVTINPYSMEVKKAGALCRNRASMNEVEAIGISSEREADSLVCWNEVSFSPFHGSSERSDDRARTVHEFCKKVLELIDRAQLLVA